MKKSVLRGFVFLLLAIILVCSAVPASPLLAQGNPETPRHVTIYVTDLGINQWNSGYTTQIATSGSFFSTKIENPSFPGATGISILQPTTTPGPQAMKDGFNSNILQVTQNNPGISEFKFEVRIIQNTGTAQQLTYEQFGEQLGLTVTPQSQLTAAALSGLSDLKSSLEAKGFTVDIQGVFSSNGARAVTTAIAKGAPVPFKNLVLVDSRGTVKETREAIIQCKKAGVAVTLVNTVGDYGMYTQSARHTHFLYGLPLSPLFPKIVAEKIFAEEIASDPELSGSVRLLEIKIDDKRTLIPGWAHGKAMTWPNEDQKGDGQKNTDKIRVREYLGDDEGWSEPYTVSGEDLRENVFLNSGPLSGQDLKDSVAWNAPLSSKKGDDKKPIFFPPGGDLSGVDFSTLQLNYVSESSLDATQSFTYIFSSDVADPQAQPIDVNLTSKLAFDTFFTWLALPSGTFWVNLHPNEPNRIIDERLGHTDAGRVMLEADLEMKKTVARLIHPETGPYRAYWDKMYTYLRAHGVTGVMCPFIRVWIVPGQVDVWTTEDSIYIVKALLDVKMESDYLQQVGGNPQSFMNAMCPDPDPDAQAYGEQVFREMVLPELIHEVNTAPEYQPLRTAFYSRVLAEWYKARDRSTVQPFFADLIDQGDASEWYMTSSWTPQTVYDAYLDSMTNGEFAILKGARTDEGTLLYTYWFGGVNLMQVPMHHLNEYQAAAQVPDLEQKLLGAVSESQGYRSAREAWLGSSFVRNVTNTTDEVIAEMPDITLSSAPPPNVALPEENPDAEKPAPMTREYIQQATLGFSYLSQGMYLRAVDSFTQALQYQPDSIFALNGRATAYNYLAENGKALDDLNRAIQIAPDDPMAYGLRGTIVGKTDRQAGLADLNRAIELSPDPAVAYSDRGAFYMELGEYQAALDDFNQAITLDPNGAYYYVGRAMVYVSLYDIQAAIDDLAEYTRLVGKNALPEITGLLTEFPMSTAQEYRSRGDAYYYLGSYKDAISDYTSAISYDPGYAAAYGGRGIVYSALGQHGEALADLDRAIDLGYDDPRVFRARAAVYYYLRDWEDAIKDLREYVRRAGDSAEADALEDIAELEGRFADLGAFELEPTRAYTLAGLNLRFAYPITWADPSPLSGSVFVGVQLGEVSADAPAIAIIRGLPQDLANSGLAAGTTPEQALDGMYGDALHMVREVNSAGSPVWKAMGGDASGVMLKVYLFEYGGEWVILAGRAPMSQFDAFDVTVFEPLVRSLEIMR